MNFQKGKFRLNLMNFTHHKHIELVIGSSNVLAIRYSKNTSGTKRHPRRSLSLTIMVFGHTMGFQIEYTNYNLPKDG